MRNAMWVGGGITGIGRIPILGVKKKGLSDLIQKMFSNGEQGFFYDPNDLSTLYQDAAGTIPVTSVGQPVGLMLDKSNGLVLGNELSNYSAGFNSLAGILPVGATLSLEGTALAITAQGGVSRRAEIPISGLTVGKYYKIKFIARKNEIGIQQGFQQFTAFTKFSYQAVVVSTTAAEYTFILEATAVSGVLRAYATSGEAVGAKMVVESVSVKEVVGNHAYQTTSASRPILRDTPRRIDFDAVDDKLITKLPSQLTGCTVIRSVPNVGTQILTGQTILATYNDNTDHCGLLVINRALTTSETSTITAEFNKRAGI